MTPSGDTLTPQKRGLTRGAGIRLGCVGANGATWLDRQLVAREPASLSSGGFGQEVRDAMNARIERLAGQGLARRQGQRILFARDLLDTLRRRELEATAGRIASSTGMDYHPAKEGEIVAGVYRRRVDLASGRFAMIDGGLGFSLVPWSPSFEPHLSCRGLRRPQELSGTSGEHVAEPLDNATQTGQRELP